MKRIISLLIVCLTLIPCAFADDADWYYPFGLTDDSTYDQTVNLLVEMYGQDGATVTRTDTQTDISPVNKTMFDIPLKAIRITKGDDEKHRIIVLAMYDTYKPNSAYHFLDAVTYLIENTKADFLKISPSSVTYDLEGNQIQTDFLSDIPTFVSGFSTQSEECSIMWKDACITLQRDKDGFLVQLFFAGKSIYR